VPEICRVAPVAGGRRDPGEAREVVVRGLVVADGDPNADRTADILVALKDGLLVGADLDDPAVRGVIRDAVGRTLAGYGDDRPSSSATAGASTA
jgi:hypothetical protein